MASPKKIQPKKIIKTTLTFLAGLALPVSLAVGWHVAYGQQDAPDKPRQAYTGGPQRVPQPYQPGPVATSAPQPQAKPAQTAQPAAQASTKQPVNVASVEQAPTVPAGDELDDMRRIFSSTVQQPNMERMDRYIKGWKNAPKVQQALEDRRNRLARMDRRFLDFVREDVSAQLKQRGMTFERSQYFVYADRNPKTQFVLVGFYDSDARHIEFLGADLMSSGNLEKGGDYYVTPTGVFENLVDNFGYRALGTPNQEGWRGLGAKDSRVWDFGDQKSVKKYKGGNTVSQMRLLMHSTDPDKGEPRLGRTDSKGCVRISHTLNHFLDTYAILDLNYEQWAKTRPESWLLKKDRRPVSHPGKYLIVGDSSSYFTAQANP
ncbi:hypothetical protein [Fundidesulfovibrio soli]|uniref:hypothetical protein n=1 Tax=Fundidesulfovibrio soli TaxID=2922716 RepID=UPI001FAF8A87|nr:hypothetical protein [Fundidesulfovibrio soli]